MRLEEINVLIQDLLGVDIPLKTYEKDSILWLGDGQNISAEIDKPSKLAVAELIYDWAVFTGYTIDSFEDFVGSILYRGLKEIAP